jgi:hypothetical protein
LNASSSRSTRRARASSLFRLSCCGKRSLASQRSTVRSDAPTADASSVLEIPRLFIRCSSCSPSVLMRGMGRTPCRTVEVGPARALLEARHEPDRPSGWIARVAPSERIRSPRLRLTIRVSSKFVNQNLNARFCRDTEGRMNRLTRAAVPPADVGDGVGRRPTLGACRILL